MSKEEILTKLITLAAVGFSDTARLAAGNHKQTVSTLMDEREVIVLDDSRLDKRAIAAISQQRAVESVLEVKTQYQLVSKAFKAVSSSIEIGDTINSQLVIIGGSHSTPV